MNIIIVYFSGTGNTWWAADKLKQELENSDQQVEMFSLENPQLRDQDFLKGKIAAADHVIIGYPVYGSDQPRNMQEFVANLPEGGGTKRFSAFCTQASFSGDANVFFKAEVEAKGYKFRQSFQLNITTNFNVAMFPFSLTTPASGSKLEKILQKAGEKIARMASYITKDHENIEGEGLFQRIAGGFQRNLFRKKGPEFVKKFQFFADRCSKCNICVNNCPTGNITLETNTPTLHWGDNCLLCFRCYNFCPTKAINFGGKDR